MSADSEKQHETKSQRKNTSTPGFGKADFVGYYTELYNSK